MLLFALLTTLLLAYQSPLIKAPFNSLDKGWLSFEYGPKDTEAYKVFTVASPVPVVLRITDTLQPGSSFLVVREPGDEALLVTPTPKRDTGKWTRNPLRAYNSDDWSHGEAVLPIGFSQIRIFVREAPYDSGVGAINFESARLCKYRLGRLFVVDAMVGWPRAEQLCEAYGAELADLHETMRKGQKRHTSILRRAFALVNKCRVEDGRVWIAGQKLVRDEDEDAFPSSLQVLSPTEGITGAEWEHSRMSVLCRARRPTHRRNGGKEDSS